ncbi:hypothetical protein MRB53_040246 [Persea americana]|nr:hypothetical protein MRB53_040246 [Persea americana]
MTSASSDTVTDATRQALLTSLSQPSAFGSGLRKLSQPHGSSPLSPRDPNKPVGLAATFPSTSDLQRYINAYTHFFHPHFPFLHIPTLNFDSPTFTTNVRYASNGSLGEGGLMGGGGCLVLAMSAIGALYEFERGPSKDLFESSKKLMQIYLEERRKADHASSNGRLSPASAASQNTPLWLVQAMLLNVIYGHQCGDKTAGEIASTHCAALVSLARAAGLIVTPAGRNNMAGPHMGNSGPMLKDPQFTDHWQAPGMAHDEVTQWHQWAAAEERRRTLFAIFHMSSMLVSGYNHAPALMNSEMFIDLPCDEDLWQADSAVVWAKKGGAAYAAHRALSFPGRTGNASHRWRTHRHAF